MQNRRDFLKKTVLAGAGVSIGMKTMVSCQTATKSTVPIIISTWNAGVEANAAAMKKMVAGGSSLDAVEEGVKVCERDPKNQSVGYGGNPDRDGFVTLDACIMDHTGNAGSVTFLEDIMHPISVARKVMEDTPHVLLSGEGARKFAIENGFKPQNLLTEKSEKDYKKWLEKSEYKPIINIENHDTIGMLAIDKTGNVAGACTTSGLAYKMRGRVGDSPIIGSGLYVDNEVGAATATGLGEEIMKSVSSFLIVELMRNGMSPQAACEEAVARICKRAGDYSNFQAAFVAISRSGEYGAYAIHPGFSFAVSTEAGDVLVESGSYAGKKG